MPEFLQKLETAKYLEVFGKNKDISKGINSELDFYKLMTLSDPDPKKKMEQIKLNLMKIPDNLKLPSRAIFLTAY